MPNDGGSHTSLGSINGLALPHETSLIIFETARDNLRRLVRRVLRRHGYPPDQQQTATDLVLEQAELLAPAWAA